MREIEIPVGNISASPKAISPLATDNRDKYTGSGKRVGITTMGCKVNTYESELIGETLKTDNWQLVPSTQTADLYLINTCTVTREADRQARQEVRKAVKRNPDALVVVTGCYAQMDPQACADIPGVDLVLGNDRKLDLHNLLPELENNSLPKTMVGDLDEHLSLPDKLLTGYEKHTRAFVQIQQGCDQGCTFCIIHVARGPSRSLAPSLIKRQVQRLALNGYPEIVICGVDLGSYGDDFMGSGSQFDLVDLLKELLELEHDESNPFRLRLSSIDPHHITDRLIDLMASEPRLCPHIHLSLQSGNRLILKRMKRRYGPDHVRKRIASLRNRIPNFVLSADVMVGFPTETFEQYLDTEQMVADIEVAFPHTFSYSEREGTPMARMPLDRTVPVPERKARNKRLRESAKPILENVLSRQIGTRGYVLREQRRDQQDRIFCRAENYLEVELQDSYLDYGRWQEVEFTGVKQGRLLAVCV